MEGLTSNLRNVFSRAVVLMLPLLFFPMSVESGAIEPRLACGSETEDDKCTFASLRMCELYGEMIQNAMPDLD